MDTLQARHEQIKQQLRQAAPRIVQTMALSGLALVTLRIQRDGLPGKTYSTKDFPLFWFTNKALNAAGNAWLAGKKKRTGAERKSDPANWGGFRRAQGLPSNTVNLTYTGGMFRALHALPGSGSGTLYTAAIAASDSESTAKMQYNMARYGDFLEPMPAEAAQVQRVGAIELDKIIAAGLKTA